LRRFRGPYARGYFLYFNVSHSSFGQKCPGDFHAGFLVVPGRIGKAGVVKPGGQQYRFPVLSAQAAPETNRFRRLDNFPRVLEGMVKKPTSG
jgi:hypothetical protein